MPLVAGKCPNCGAPLEVDNSSKAWLCPYCNTPIITEEAITNYNITNNIQAETVIIQGQSIDTLIKRIELLLEEANITEANNKLSEALSIDPENALLNIYHLMIKHGIYRKKYIIEGVFALGDDFVNDISFIRANNNASGELKKELEWYIEVNHMLNNNDDLTKLNDKLAEKGYYVFGKNPLEKNSYRKTPLLWRIIDSKDDMMLLFCSRPILKMGMCSMYGTAIWENCGLNKDLNKYKIKMFFNKEEESRIVPVDSSIVDNSKFNKLFLLSKEEFNKYCMYNCDRLISCPDKKYFGLLGWWLRAPKKGYQTKVYYVDSKGNVGNQFASGAYAQNGVRPAMWIKK